jgi:hypothetical protein
MDRVQIMFGRDYKCWLENVMAKKLHMDLKAMRWEGVDKIDLAQDRV